MRTTEPLAVKTRQQISTLFDFANDEFMHCLDESLSCKLFDASEGVTDCISDSLDLELSRVSLLVDS